MIWMTFECPETGQPLRTVRTSLWSADSSGALMALHCPKCSHMHMFSRADAILEMGSGAAPTRAPVARSAA